VLLARYIVDNDDDVAAAAAAADDDDIVGLRSTFECKYCNRFIHVHLQTSRSQHCVRLACGSYFMMAVHLRLRHLYALCLFHEHVTYLPRYRNGVRMRIGQCGSTWRRCLSTSQIHHMTWRASSGNGTFSYLSRRVRRCDIVLNCRTQNINMSTAL